MLETCYFWIFSDQNFKTRCFPEKIGKKYKSDLIVLTGNLYGEIPSKILNTGEEQAEESLLWWHKEFGTDFYIEVMRHGQEDENRANEILIEFSKKNNLELNRDIKNYLLQKKMLL